MVSPYQKRALRNFSSAGNSAAKFTYRAAGKTAGGLFRWATTDHLDTAGAIGRMPKMGVVDSLWYGGVLLLIHIGGAILAGVLVFLLIAVAIPLLLGGSS